MLKLTRLNNQVVAVNPDHIASVDATPDTTLKLIGGDRIIVRESLDDLIEQLVQFRHRVLTPGGESDASAVTVMTRFRSERVRAAGGGE